MPALLCLWYAALPISIRTNMRKYKMKKNGFTLQEALITVGIIGIVAAITIPALTKIMPNRYQTRYLKAYSAISN